MDNRNIQKNLKIKNWCYNIYIYINKSLHIHWRKTDKITDLAWNLFSNKLVFRIIITHMIVRQIRDKSLLPPLSLKMTYFLCHVR